MCDDDAGSDAAEWHGGPEFGSEEAGRESGGGTSGPETYPTYGTFRPSGGSGGSRKWVLGCLLLLGLFVLIGVIGCAVAWGPFVRFGMDTDLIDYREAVRQSGLEEGRKSRLVLKIEHLRDALSRESIGFFDWVSHSEAIDPLIADGTLTEAETVLLERELERIAETLGTTFPGEVEEPGPPPSKP